MSSESTATMYPRVRVKVRGGGEEEDEEREQENPVSVQDENSSLLLKVFESISLHSRFSPGNEHQSASLPQARVPKSYVPNVPMPSISVSKDATSRSTGKKKKEVDEESRTNIRASSVPRPRAVLSSPNNDEMIGSRNRLSRDRQSITKANNLVGQTTPAEGKRVLKNANAESPVNGKRVLKEAHSKVLPKEKNATEVSVPRQKACLRKGKPNNVGL